MDTVERQIIDGTEALGAAIARARAAERKFSTYTQEEVDAIFKAPRKSGIPLPVETPAPPKNTMLSASPIIFSSPGYSIACPLSVIGIFP